MSEDERNFDSGITFNYSELADIKIWKRKSSSIFEDYSTRNVSNGDKIGPYYRVIPTETFALRGDKYADRKTTTN